MTSADGTPHRRDDGELLGWIRPDGDRWTPIDLLGRPVSPPVEWLEAEAALEGAGLSYLAEPWMPEDPDAGDDDLNGHGDARADDGADDDDDSGRGTAVRVRFVEVTPDRIVVKAEDFGAVGSPTRRWVLPWPVPARLRPWRPGDPDPFVIERRT